MFKTKKKYMVFILSLLLLPCIVVAKSTNDYFNRTFISQYGYVDSNGHHGNFERFRRNSDNNIAYCIEPGVSFSSEEYEGVYDISFDELAEIANVSKKRLNEASLYAYFGYYYHGHTGDEWITATQALIWEALGRDFSFTDGYHPDNPEDYIIDAPSEVEDCMDYIIDKVDTYLEEPDFKDENIILSNYEQYNFGKANKFDVVECKNCEYKIKNDYLLVTPTASAGKVILEKKLDDYEATFVVYAKDEGQNLLVPGNVEPLEAEVSFEVVNGSLKLLKYDQDSKTCKPQEGGKLEGSTYKLYKEDNTFVKDLVIGSDCSVEVNSLELGNYYLKESVAGTNYELDPKIYTFSITRDNPNKELIVYDKMFLGQVELKKVDSYTKTCESSSSFASLTGAIYGIYNEKNELIDKLVIGDNCTSKSKRNLLLGKYYIKEIKAPTGYRLDPKKYYFSVTKENAGNIISLTVEDNIYETKLVINKSYLYFNINVLEENATFAILKKDTLEKVGDLTTNSLGVAELTLPYGEYILKQTGGQEGYHFVEDTIISINEQTDEFTVLNLVNEPFKGTLVFTKTDLLTGELLPNVLIDVFNELNELVYQGFTDESGEIKIANLPYGSYMILEIAPLDGYYQELDPVYFAITKDGETVNVEMENEQIVNVPETSKNEINSAAMYGFILSFLGMGFVMYGKKISE